MPDKISVAKGEEKLYVSLYDGASSYGVINGKVD